MPNAQAEAGSRLAGRLPRSRHASCGHCLSRLVGQIHLLVLVSQPVRRIVSGNLTNSALIPCDSILLWTSAIKSSQDSSLHLWARSPFSNTCKAASPDVSYTCAQTTLVRSELDIAWASWGGVVSCDSTIWVQPPPTSETAIFHFEAVEADSNAEMACSTSARTKRLSMFRDIPLCPTLKRRRGHGWRGGCPAADMPAVAVASLVWLGKFFQIRNASTRR